MTRGVRDTGGKKGKGQVKSRNMYKEPMDKANGGGKIECGRLGVVGESGVGKVEMTVVVQQ